MEKDELLPLVADIVSAHVANNNVDSAELGSLVQTVYGALAGLGQDVEPEPVEKTPAVSIKASVKPDYLVCLECGAKQKTIKRHLMTAHGLTPEQYRQDYNLPSTYPMVAPSYSARRRELAKQIGLGRDPNVRRGRKPKAGAAKAKAAK